MQSHEETCRRRIDGARTFMNSRMVVGGYFFWGPWIMALSRGHTNQAME